MLLTILQLDLGGQDLGSPSYKQYFDSGSHQLLLLNYYPYIARFLAPHQREVN
jgi:hypothetical protein